MADHKPLKTEADGNQSPQKEVAPPASGWRSLLRKSAPKEVKADIGKPPKTRGFSIRRLGTQNQVASAPVTPALRQARSSSARLNLGSA